MSTPSPTVRFNKRKPSFESLGQSAFYPDGSTSSAATNGATADKNPPDLRRKSPRTNKSISATDVIPSEAPASVPLAPAPSWPPGRITRALPPGDLVKIHLTVPPISRWQTLSNERPIHISTPFSSWVYPNRASPGASVDPTPSLLGNIAYVNSHGHLTPPRERFSHSELLQLKNENREIWWSVEQLARADSATDLPNLGHLALDSPSPDIGNALGLYTSSPSIPLPPLPQGNITRLPSAPVSPHETTASFDNLLMLLDSDIRSEIINFSGPSFKSADNGHSLNMWSNANLERGLSSKVEKAGEESEVAEQISALRRGSTSELPSQQVLVDGRPLLSSYTMPALSHMGLPCSPDTSVEMPRSVTPSPIGRSPTPSPLNFFYQDTETSDLIDPYYLGEDSSEVEPDTAPMEVESRDVAEPETPANPMRFWRSRDTSPDRLDRERDSPSSSASMLSRFIRDLPMVPDYDRDNAQDLWPRSPEAAQSGDCPPEMNETSEDRAEFLPEGDENLFDLSFRRAVALDDQPVDDQDMEHDDYDYEQDDVEYEDENEYEYDDYNVSDDDQFPHSRAIHREAECVQSEPIYHIGQFEQQPRPIPVLAPGPAPHLARYASQYLDGRILNPDFAVRYDIVDELGKGAFGFVCTALDKQRNVEVAVKFIYKYPNVRQGMRIHMIGHEPRESHILSRLNHPGIISFIDLFEDAEYFYMELHGDPWRRPRIHSVRAELETAEIQTARRVQVGIDSPSTSTSTSTPALSPSTSITSPYTPFERPGMLRRASYDLFEAIEKDSFNEQEARFIFLQLVDALRYMHDARVYHRDLKDENIVMDQNLIVKIIDFGCAVYEQHEDPPTYYTMFTGTRTYAPPEIIIRGGEPAEEQYYLAGPADVWCLGIILAMLLTGFAPPQISQAARNQTLGQIPCDPAATDIVKACLRLDPNERATIEEIAVHPWVTGVLDK